MRGHEPFSQSSVGRLLPHGQGFLLLLLAGLTGGLCSAPGTHSPPRQWSCGRLPVLLVGEGVTSDPCRHKVQQGRVGTLWPGPQPPLHLASAEIRCVLPAGRTGSPRQLLLSRPCSRPPVPEGLQRAPCRVAFLMAGGSSSSSSSWPVRGSLLYYTKLRIIRIPSLSPSRSDMRGKERIQIMGRFG